MPCDDHLHILGSGVEVLLSENGASVTGTVARERK